MPLLWTPSHIVADVSLTGAATFLEATGLNYNRDGPYTIHWWVHEVGGTTPRLYLHLNGDTTNANYYTQRVYAAGAGITAQNYNEPYITVVYPNQTAIATIKLHLDVDGYPRWTDQGGYNINANLRVHIGSGRKTGTLANITSIRMTSQVANAIGAGTRMLITRTGH